MDEEKSHEIEENVENNLFTGRILRCKAYSFSLDLPI